MAHYYVPVAHYYMSVAHYYMSVAYHFDSARETTYWIICPSRREQEHDI